MSVPFDPYQAWLDIPPQHQPPDHYRLLGLRRFEHDPQRIEQAAQERIAAVQAHQSGPHAEQCRRLLHELSAARSCLLNEQRRAAYDRALLESAVQQAARPAERGGQPKLSAEQFLDLLDEKDLLPGELLLSLRRGLLELGGAVPAEKIAQLLVRKGVLTPILARRLLFAAGAETDTRTPAPERGPATQRPAPGAEKPLAPPATTRPPAHKTAQPGQPTKESSGSKVGPEDTGLPPAEQDLGFAPLEEELGLAPLKKDRGLPRLKKDRGLASLEEDGGLAPLKEDSGLAAPLERQPRTSAARKPETPRRTPSAAAGAKPAADQTPAARAAPKQAKGPGTPSSDAAPAGPSGPEGLGSLLDEELPPLGSEGADAVGDLLLNGAALPAGPGLAPGQPAWGAARGWLTRLRGLRRSVWAGAAGAVLLLAGGLLVYRTLGSRSAGAALPEAEAHFRAGHYAEAALLYDRYLNWHSHRAEASAARVARVRARLHQLVEHAAAPQQVVAVAGELLPSIVAEPAYGEQAAADVALLLMRVAETAIAQARQQKNAAVLGQARAALELVERCTPPTIQQGNALARLEAALARTAKELRRAGQLAGALAAFDRAATARDPQAAQAALLSVTEHFPELAADEKLQSALRSLAELWRQTVRWVAAPLKPDQNRFSSPAAAAVVLCHSHPADAEPDPAAPPVLVALRGAVWALDAATGRVLWQQALAAADASAVVYLPGQTVATANSPSGGGGSVLLADRLRGALLCVEPRDGRLRWRLALDEPMALASAPLGGKAVVATQHGRVLAVELSTGAVQGYFQLPAAVELPPAADAAHGLVFQPACAGRVLFVLDFNEQRCVQADVLGEGTQSLAGPVVLAGDRLLAGVNGPRRSGVLRVFSISARPSKQRGPLRLLERIAIDGPLAGVPVACDSDVLVISQTGHAQLFQWDEKGTLKLLLSQALLADAGLPCSALLVGDRLWLACGPLRAYRIDRAEKRLVLEWVDPAGQTVAALLPPAGEKVCYLRRVPQVPGAVPQAPGAEAVAMPALGPLLAPGSSAAFAKGAPDASKGPVGEERISGQWKTALGVPALADSLVQTSPGQCLIANAAGAIFAWQWPEVVAAEDDPSPAGAGRTAANAKAGALGAQTATVQIVDQPLAVAGPESTGRPFQWAQMCGDLLVLTASESQSAWVLEPKNAAAGPRRVWLPAAPALRPVVLGDKLLLATRGRQVWLFDPRAGAAAAAPFQAPFTADGLFGLRSLAVVGQSEAILCDAGGRLYELHLEQQPVAHLAGMCSAGQARIVSALAAAGKSLFGVDQGGRLLRFELPELLPVATALEGIQPIWGPLSAGGLIWLADGQGRVACVSAAGDVRWQIVLEGGPPQGLPLVEEEEESVWLATAHGVVLRLALETGEQLGRTETARRLASGVVRCGGRLAVCTADGALVEVGQR